MIRLPISKVRFDPIENLYKVAFGLERLILHKHDKDMVAVISLDDLHLLETIKSISSDQQKIIETSAQLAAIVESSEDAIIGKTLDGIITSWNPGAERLYGYTAKEIVGRSVSILIPQNRPNEVPEILQKICQGEHVNHYETIRTRKDGKEITVSLTISPIKDAHNNIIGASTIARDITEQKKSEEELRYSREQLRALSRRLQSIQEEEREHITSELQKEFGQVLTVLKMDLAWLAKRLPVNGEFLQKKIEKMKDLLDQTILNISKISKELRPKALDDFGLITAIEWEINEFQKRTGITCNINISEDIELDSARSISVFRILQEGLNSLAKYTNHISINLYQSANLSMLVLELTDNNSNTFEQKAIITSLDLFSLQERALLLGGKAEIKQESEKLVISISIPLPKDTSFDNKNTLNSNITNKQDESQYLPVHNKRKRKTVSKILIADSHTIVREGLKQILAEIPDVIVAGEASNSKELLQKIRTNVWDVAIMDISLPDKNGLDLIKQIKLECPNLPILVLSTQAEESYALRVIKAGASGFLNKESAPDELIQAVQKVANGGQYVSETVAEKLIFDLKNDTDTPLHKNLSDREFQIFCLIASGKTTKEIAQELNLSIKTVSTYRSKLLEKMGLKNNVEIVRYAIKTNLLS